MVHGRKSIKDRYGVNEFSQFTGAEMMAQIYGFTREELDAFALSSHRKAAAAADSEAFEREIVVVEGVDKEGNARHHDRDEGIRADASLEGLAELKTITANGMITAGNASQVCDGASGVLIVSEQALKQHGLTPIARIDNLTVTAGDPVIMLEEPIPATRRALERSGRKLDEIDLYEVNEAFAPVPLAWLKEIGADPERLNVNGGAIALGHPLGRERRQADGDPGPCAARPRQALWPADHVRRRRHRQCDDRRGALISVEVARLGQDANVPGMPVAWIGFAVKAVRPSVRLPSIALRSNTRRAIRCITPSLLRCTSPSTSISRAAITARR